MLGCAGTWHVHCNFNFKNLPRTTRDGWAPKHIRRLPDAGQASTPGLTILLRYFFALSSVCFFSDFM
jgi:hypothetical protein